MLCHRISNVGRCLPPSRQRLFLRLVSTETIQSSTPTSPLLQTPKESGPILRAVPIQIKVESTPQISDSHQSSTSRAYTVARTPSQQLPVYQLKKGGGTLLLTKIRKASGNLQELVKDLEVILEPKPKYVEINKLTGHVMVKGHYKGQVEQFLLKRGF